MGTFAYMSPEQVRGRTPRRPHRSLLARRRALRDDRRPPAVRRRDRDRGGRSHPQSRAAGAGAVQLRVCPTRSTGIVIKALQKDARFRYQSARELYIDLHHLTRSLGEDDAIAAATRGRAPGRARATARTSGAPDAARQAVQTGPPRSATEPVVAVMTFSNTTRNPADDWIGSGIAETVTADLKGVRGLVGHRPGAGVRCHQAPERLGPRAGRRRAGHRHRPPSQRVVHRRRRLPAARADDPHHRRMRRRPIRRAGADAQARWQRRRSLHAPGPHRRRAEGRARAGDARHRRRASPRSSLPRAATPSRWTPTRRSRAGS